MAMIDRRVGDDRAAQQRLRRWLADNADDSGARMMLASSQLASGERVEAMRNYEVVLDSGRESVVALNNLALVVSGRR